jgi:hypothetical protein
VTVDADQLAEMMDLAELFPWRHLSNVPPGAHIPRIKAGQNSAGLCRISPPSASSPFELRLLHGSCMGFEFGGGVPRSRNASPSPPLPNQAAPTALLVHWLLHVLQAIARQLRGRPYCASISLCPLWHASSAARSRGPGRWLIRAAMEAGGEG